MQINTTRFGNVTVVEDDTVLFADGLPGFEQSRRFVFLPHTSAEGGVSPFRWMQSIEDGALAFPVISPWQVSADYAPKVPGGVLRELQISSIKDQAKFWAIVTIPRDRPNDSTVNLLAPILINREMRTARQVILLSEHYSLRTPLCIRRDEHSASEVASRIDSTVSAILGGGNVRPMLASA